MTDYAALLRGVSPLNASMPDLKKAFEKAGFTDVRTVLGSGNVLFRARTASEAALERRAEAAQQDRLGRTFYTIIRPVEALRTLLASDPYAAFGLKSGTKRVVTFFRDVPTAKARLPVELEGARILALKGRELFSAYVPGPSGPVFMTLIERTFGKDVTTRTWETVTKLTRK